jgi:hypothetical protein
MHSPRFRFYERKFHQKKSQPQLHGRITDSKESDTDGEKEYINGFHF